jgi:cell division protein FtsL
MVSKRWSLREVALAAAVALMALGILTFYIWYQTEAVRLGIAIGETRAAIAGLKEEIQKLETRRAELLSPDKVDRIARESLGLGDPRPDQIVFEIEEEAPPSRRRP